VEGEAPHPRKYYRLTRLGTRRLAEMTEQWRVFAAKIGRLITASEGSRRDTE
jgi:DNA-binding PadR family transcriptional regulator